MSLQPIPLAYLGIDRFDLPPENKREKRGSVIENFRNSNPLVPMYPFTVYHIARKEKHTYTFYASSEAARKKWYDVILDAMSIYNVKMDVNKVRGRPSRSGFFLTIIRSGSYQTQSTTEHTEYVQTRYLRPRINNSLGK